MKDLGWNGYVLEDYSFVEFAPEMRVLDVGCGYGTQLQELGQRGCRAFGIEVDRAALADCRSRGLRVLHACAEQIPVKNAGLDGLVCKVVIPYTDEARVVSEIGRVLKRESVGHLCYHGAGYSLRYLVFAPSWKFRFYGLRTLVNTWLYRATGRRLPGFLGDTIYQSRRRLAKYYRENGLRLLQESPARAFLGFPVFIYHTIQRVRD